MADGGAEFTEIAALAADCLARAIARGVYEATALPFEGAVPAWRDLHGNRAASSHSTQG